MKKAIVGSILLAGLTVSNVFAGVGSPLTFYPSATSVKALLKIEQVRPEAIEHYSTGDLENWSDNLKSVAKEIRKDTQFKEKNLSDLEVLEIIIEAE